MFTTVDDPGQNGTQEEANPSGQAGVEGPPAVQPSQGAETSGGEEDVDQRDAFVQPPTSHRAENVPCS